MVLAQGLAAINSVGTCALRNRTPRRVAKVQLIQSILSQLSTAPLYLCPMGLSTFTGDWRPSASHWSQLSSWWSGTTEDRSMHRFALFLPVFNPKPTKTLFMLESESPVTWDPYF